MLPRFDDVSILLITPWKKKNVLQKSREQIINTFVKFHNFTTDNSQII